MMRWRTTSLSDDGEDHERVGWWWRGAFGDSEQTDGSICLGVPGQQTRLLTEVHTRLIDPSIAIVHVR